MTHLSEEAWRELRAGTLEGSERARVLQHLGEACDECDAQAELFDEPALDGAIDVALASLPVEPAGVDSLLLHRVDRRVHRELFPRRRAPWLALVPVALAAGLALFLAGPLTALDPRQRLKGEVLRPPELTAVVSVQKGSPLEPLDPPRAYPSTAQLFFTYDLPQDSHVYLGRVGIDGAVEPFYPPLGVSDAIERAGLHSLTVGGTVHAYALEGLAGKQRFVLLCSPAALEGPALAQALKEASAGSASLEVQVKEW